MAEPDVSPRARRDLEDIFHFISDDDQAAERIIRKIEKAIFLLGERPFLGSTIILPGGLKLRKMSAHPYIVFYRNADTMVQVVRVLHSSRDLRNPMLFPSK